jgi:predicted lipoprotein with Yx(FWY)xxD motif
MNRWRGPVVITGMSAERRPGAASRLVLRVIGAGLLIATAAIHLDLYLTGYRSIPTIGWLFLLQVIAAFALGGLVLVTGNRLVAALGAGFALSTLGGYLLSVQFGLFGFREVRTTAGIVAGIIEVLAFAVLTFLAATPSTAALAADDQSAAAMAAAAARRGGVGGVADTAPGGVHSAAAHGPGSHGSSWHGPSWLPAGVSGVQAALGAAAISVVALGLLGGALAGAGGSGASSSGSSAGAGLRTASIGGATVLTNASGRTLYSFAPDTSSKSVCNGSCAQYWPPVPGPLKAGAGVTGTLATITRADGSTQETYDGHPLYTYIGDSGPGQDHGNNLNLNGGLWHIVPVQG